MVKKEHVYLIDLGTGTDRSLLPLACCLLKSYSQSFQEINNHYYIHIRMLKEGIEELIDEIEYPSVVGFSCYCWNFLGNVEVSRRLKDKFPNVLIIWGGPSIPAKSNRIRPFLLKHEYVDIVVHGEGEFTFADILLRTIRGESFADCQGISYRSSNREEGNPIFTNNKRERIRDLSIIPSPFLNGICDRILELYKDQIVGVLWETSRGCPFHCTFCDWGNSLVNKINLFEINRVIEEIKWVSQHKIHYVYATDANFGITLNRDLEIAKRLVSITKGNGFPNTLILNWTKNSYSNIIQLADVLRSGGVITNITLSCQSFYEPTVKAIKRKNLKLEYLKKLKTEFHNSNLATYSEIILALPEETLDSFVSGIEQGLSSNLKDQLSIYLCVILENTDLQESMGKYGIETRRCAVGLNRRKFKYARFGEDEIVVGTSSMPIPDWERAYEIAFSVMSFFNLRVAFFVIVYFKEVFGAKVTDFVMSTLDIIDNAEDKFPIFSKAVSHLRSTRQLILDGIASVRPVEGGNGVALTPHEAMAFLLFNQMDQTYKELTGICEIFSKTNGFPLLDDVLSDIIKYQRSRIPTFRIDQKYLDFQTNIPVFFDALTTNTGKNIPEINKSHTVIQIVDHPSVFVFITHIG